MEKKKVLVLFGGISEEHDISIKSAGQVATSLNPDKYEVTYVGITRSGEWKLCQEPCPEWEDEALNSAFIVPDKSIRGLMVEENGTFQKKSIDVVLPVLHGKNGEDGAMQGLLELSGIPYVGCDIASSAICMDKSLAYVVADHAKIHVPAFQIVHKHDCIDKKKMDYPVFVKPARSGSSFGVSKVTCEEELEAAITQALNYDDKVLIEEAITGTEVGCAVLGNGSKLMVGEIDQICLTHGFFRIHQEKSPEKGSENSSVIVPADITAKDREHVQETAKAIYHALGCKGLARVDMFLQDNGRVVLNEVNTFPGCTIYSRYPRMMAAAGYTMADILDRIIKLALEK